MAKLKQILFYCLIIFFVCISQNTIASENEQMTAVVITGAAGWSSGAHSIVSGKPINGHRTVQNKILPTISELGISSYRHYFYRIERFQSDNISKFDISEPGNVIWNVTAVSETEPNLQSHSSNPYAMVFASNEKAYLIRYGAKTVWIVNPSVSYENRHQFKTGQLDLGAYANENGSDNYDDTDGYPEMCAGLIVDGKLFIVMQRLVDWCPKETVHSYVAVFDVSTDTEVNTQKGEGNLKGIKLPSPVYNAGYPENSSIHYLEENNKIYVSGCASMGFCTNNAGGKGGVVSIDPESFETKVVLDGSTDTWSYGNVLSTSIVSPDKGYFVSVPDAYGDASQNTVNIFNPSTGEVIDSISFFNGKDIRSMNLDRYNKLWMCNSTDSDIIILDTSDDTIEERVITNPLPKVVSFIYTSNSQNDDVDQDGISDQDADDPLNDDIAQENTDVIDQTPEEDVLTTSNEDSGIGECFIQISAECFFNFF